MCLDTARTKNTAAIFTAANRCLKLILCITNDLKMCRLSYKALYQCFGLKRTTPGRVLLFLPNCYFLSQVTLICFSAYTIPAKKPYTKVRVATWITSFCVRDSLDDLCILSFPFLGCGSCYLCFGGFQFMDALGDICQLSKQGCFKFTLRQSLDSPLCL